MEAGLKSSSNHTMEAPLISVSLGGIPTSIAANDRPDDRPPGKAGPKMRSSQAGRRGAISYDSLDQTALYIRLLGMSTAPVSISFNPCCDITSCNQRVSVKRRCESEKRAGLSARTKRFASLPERRLPKFALSGPVSSRNIRRLLSFQRYLHSSRFFRGIPAQNPLHILDDDYTGQAKCMLEKVGSWKFDIFLFDRFTNVMVQEDYRSHNPYHNALHAADVTQAMFCYLQEPKLAKSLTSCDILLGLLAAVTHDLDHPGVNQLFLIKTNHYLAALYRNTSVLENHHWRSAVGLLRESGLFSHLPAEDR
ncbi:hypothetical protein JZ751_007257 [Albula glossodonta]|uniref:PDEase domain-containing protein n=1 Tax=Albula glossodonta TaxID=121402 RepID=A0A8T2NAK6_9TELE|nr:hypothetical protein JZ751_007257 [Albula glossodonta]